MQAKQQEGRKHAMEVTVTQAAALLGKSERTIQRYIEKGRLQARQLPGHRTVVNVEDLETLRGEMVDIEGILSHLESLQQEVDTLKRTVSALQSQLEALSSSPAPAPSTRRVVPQKLEGPGTALPDGLVSWRSFATLHGLDEKKHTAIQNAVNDGRLPVVRGHWREGKALVRQALDEAGRAKFYDLYHDRADFQRCPQCPHE
jgi:excisionase family DNA binding protein